MFSIVILNILQVLLQGLFIVCLLHNFFRIFVAYLFFDFGISSNIEFLLNLLYVFYVFVLLETSHGFWKNLINFFVLNIVGTIQVFGTYYFVVFPTLQIGSAFFIAFRIFFICFMYFELLVHILSEFYF